MTAQFRSDLKHREYGGLPLLHEIAKRGDPDRPPSMPVVFTSALAPRMPGWQSADRVGEISYGVSQTPQVYLDHQVYQRGGHLYLSWDAVEELFPPGLLDDMFGAYCAFLQRLALDEAAWRETKADLLPLAQMAQRTVVNDTAGSLPQGLLHDPFLDQVRKRPDHTAIATWERRLTYKDVHRHARRLAQRLRQLGAGPNRLVALVMEKGWEQVVGAIAVLEAGGAYLPVDPDLPQERRWFLLRQGEVEIVLTQPCIAERLEWPPGVQCLSVEWQSPGQEEQIEEPLAPSARETDLAYVIFTSGSTGEPKGVMIEHRSALNTVLDINERFGVGAEDRIFALSSLSFDLSVYDIFGALAAGATIVVPHPMSAREPGDWADIVRREKVTIWNSVPALLQMWVDHLESRQSDHSIRLALLSGDWIPVGLPDRARAVLPGLQLLSLGGATEASIWSISYPILTVSKDWRSIPYGQPLRNQQMHVLNDEMAPCPTWAPGQIYIGGIGLARGYWRDEAKTRAQFVSHPRSWRTPLSNRGFGTLSAGWQHRVSGSGRRSGQGAGLSDRIGGNRGNAGTTSQGEVRGGDGGGRTCGAETPRRLRGRPGCRDRGLGQPSAPTPAGIHGASGLAGTRCAAAHAKWQGEPQGTAFGRAAAERATRTGTAAARCTRAHHGFDCAGTGAAVGRSPQEPAQSGRHLDGSGAHRRTTAEGAQLPTVFSGVPARPLRRSACRALSREQRHRNQSRSTRGRITATQL